MIKFILIMFLVGMLILFVILIINWSRKDWKPKKNIF
jgi:hypothetical protein